MTERLLVLLGSLNMLLAVGAGAFGAHGLKRILNADMLAVWHTAVTYQVMHALGMIAVALLLPRLGGGAWAGWLMQIGIVLFSGSLYLLALTGTRILGAITPLGGVAFILGWAVLAWTAWRTQ